MTSDNPNIAAIYSTAKLARIMQVSTKTVSRLMRKLQIEPLTLGSKSYYRLSDIMNIDKEFAQSIIWAKQLASNELPDDFNTTFDEMI